MGMNHPGEIERLTAICRAGHRRDHQHRPGAPGRSRFYRGGGGRQGRAGGRACRPEPLPCSTETIPWSGPWPPEPPIGSASSAAAPTARSAPNRSALEPNAYAFVLELPGASLAVTLKTPGEFMVTNALAAAAVGHLAGVPLEIHPQRSRRVRAGKRAPEPHPPGRATSV